MENQMRTKSRKRARQAKRIVEIQGLPGIRIVTTKGETKLELRNRLNMPREDFRRLVNVSVRTIANIESEQKRVDKFQRNYLEVKRLCDALGEVVELDCLGDWLKTPNDAFDGFKPIEIIERGEIDRLWEMVYRLRSGMPG